MEKTLESFTKMLLKKEPEVKKEYNKLRKKYQNIKRAIRKRIKHEHAIKR